MGDNREADYTSNDPTPPDLRHGRLTWLVTLVAVPIVLGLVVMVVLQIDKDHPGPTTTAVPESPTDGKASARLPVTIAPNRDLVDGQVVTISGTGFPAGVEIAFAQCTNASETRGIDTCDLSTSTYLQGRHILTTSDGTFSEAYTVRRFLTVAGQPVDCGRGNIDPASTTVTTRPDDFTCVLGAGVLANYDISGGGPTAFAGEEFTAPTDPSSDAPPPTNVPPATFERPGESSCPTGSAPEPMTEEFDGTTITVTLPPAPIDGPCPQDER